MSDMAKKPIKITETILRDAHQSLIATRMSTEQMLPIVEKLDQVGYYSLECWGGATFDASLRFLKEDPWERLSWDIVPTATTWWSISSRNPSPTVLISFVFSTV